MQYQDMQTKLAYVEGPAKRKTRKPQDTQAGSHILCKPSFVANQAGPQIVPWCAGTRTEPAHTNPCGAPVFASQLSDVHHKLSDVHHFHITNQ